jgi:hypothetical protein
MNNPLQRGCPEKSLNRLVGKGDEGSREDMRVLIFRKDAMKQLVMK